MVRKIKRSDKIKLDEKKRLTIPIPTVESISQEVRRYTIGVLDPVDQKMLEFIATYPEMTDEDLANAVGISVDRVIRRKVSPLFRRHLQNIQSTTIDLLKKAQNKAMREAIKILNSESSNPKDIRNKIELIKTVMYPILNNPSTDAARPDKITFKSKIGEHGSLIQEVIDVEITELQKEVLGGDHNPDTDTP